MARDELKRIGFTQCQPNRHLPGKRIGDVEVVRNVLAGEDDVGLGSATRDAVQAGLVRVVAVAAVLGVGCVAAAMALRRNEAGVDRSR